jgi:hypothetical protein
MHVPLFKHGLEMHGLSRVVVVVLLFEVEVVINNAVVSDETLTDFL